MDGFVVTRYGPKIAMSTKNPTITSPESVFHDLSQANLFRRRDLRGIETSRSEKGPSPFKEIVERSAILARPRVEENVENVGENVREKHSQGDD